MKFDNLLSSTLSSSTSLSSEVSLSSGENVLVIAEWNLVSRRGRSLCGPIVYSTWNDHHL
ncbi:hypothetical protein E2C01_003979 [Portunus trituberculatus]|uniref:Uncharacterized protein n=1 Tax=Portunus trituberculatus TaxID=210409 RepID=A0A5B7CNN5_PORTR|nr:hypothetical protein [Portunus trituberculatus]